MNLRAQLSGAYLASSSGLPQRVEMLIHALLRLALPTDSRGTEAALQLKYAASLLSGASSGEVLVKKSIPLSEASLVEIGNNLYNSSADLNARQGSKHGAQEEALPESEASANSHHQNDATSEVGEGEGEGAAVAEGPKQQEQQKQRERKRGMLMSMSRADHSRFGMEAGGRSTLRAKSKPKERGELTHAFPALDTPVPPDSGETPPLEEIQRPEPPALLSRLVSAPHPLHQGGLCLLSPFAHTLLCLPPPPKGRQAFLCLRPLRAGSWLSLSRTVRFGPADGSTCHSASSDRFLPPFLLRSPPPSSRRRAPTGTGSISTGTRIVISLPLVTPMLA